MINALGELHVRERPGRASVIVVEPVAANLRFKIEIPPWTIDEYVARTNLSHDERRVLVRRLLDAIGKIAAAKLANGQAEGRTSHGQRWDWITIEVADLRDMAGGDQTV